MIRKTILTLLFVAMGMVVQAQQKKIVERPHAVFANTRTIEIAKVTLSDTETVLDIKAFFTPGYWIRIVSDSYLLADGKKYMIHTSEGIELDSLFWMPKSGEAKFKLIFEPLPIETTSFDFIESDCDDCFKIYGIDLVNKRIPLTPIPAEYLCEHKPEIDINFTFQKGKAVVTGQFLGYQPTIKNVSLEYNNPILARIETVPVMVNPDGTFTAEIDVYSPTNLVLEWNVASAPIKVAPGKESKILINLPEMYRSNSRLHRESEPYGKQFYYAGYLARLNSDLQNPNLSYSLLKDYSDEIADMDINAYKDYMLNEYYTAEAHNNTLDINSLAKTIINAGNVFRLQNSLAMGKFYLEQAYAKKHNISFEEVRTSFNVGKPSESYDDYYLLIPHDKPEVLFVPDIAYMIKNLCFACENNTDPFQVLRYLCENEQVSEEDQLYFRKFILAQEKGEKFDEISSMNEILDKYQDLTAEYMKLYSGAGFLSKKWNTDKSFLLDLLKVQSINADFENFNPLTDKQETEIATLPLSIQEVILSENDKLLAKIEENKKKTGYTVLNPPSNVDEQLFLNLKEPFKGKVILIDIWATWCGPCRAAHPLMEPVKAQYADKDVVFLYLAGEDSPENTWKNMITDISGSHYRLSHAQWDYLRSSLKVKGVPTYLILDREGNQTYYTTGFPGVDTMKRELNKALNK